MRTTGGPRPPDRRRRTTLREIRQIWAGSNQVVLRRLYFRRMNGGAYGR
jgi:hypothetical protein